MAKTLRKFSKNKSSRKNKGKQKTQKKRKTKGRKTACKKVRRCKRGGDIDRSMYPIGSYDKCN